VLDFGLAKLATGDVTDPHSSGHPQVMTETGHFIGTPAWASPEQAEGARDKIDIRTDVYSLGVIIFQMLTGTFPYEVVGKRGEVLQNIGSAPPARPSSLRRDIDRDVETIVLKCLAKERERRYQSAGELARDVRHYLGREPIEARRDSATYVIRKLLARHRLRIVGAAGLLLAATLVWGIVDARRRLGASQRTEALSDARWSLDQGDYAACLRRVQPIFERTPNDTEAVLLQARALLRLGRESEADRVLSAAVAANPQSGAIRYLLAEITAKSDPQRSSELREEARRLEKDSPQDYYLRALSAQQDQPAVDLLTHALDLNPRYFEALMARGARYFNLKAFDAMRTDAERALSIRPHDARAWCNLGIAWLNLGDDAQAVRALERAAEFDATLARVWINLGVCYERSAKAQPALECYTRAAHLDPMQFPAWMGLARIYLRLERFDDAQDALQRALNLQPKNARALYHQALLDSRRGKHEAALAGFEKCVGAPSVDQARVWLSLASTFWELRRPQDALQACQRVLEIDARSGSSWSFAAWLLLTEDTLQDFRLAHQNAQRAFELLPGDARVLGCLALAEARALEWPAADEHARRALEVSGTWSQAWPLGLCARTALESGDLERARALRAQAGDAATDYHEPDVAALQAFLREFDERVVELNKESAND
jgi:tetratricopeptide (TPR) repeat protein